jgi:hypothetical protein
MRWEDAIIMVVELSFLLCHDPEWPIAVTRLGDECLHVTGTNGTWMHGEVAIIFFYDGALSL